MHVEYLSVPFLDLMSCALKAPLTAHLIRVSITNLRSMTKWHIRITVSSGHLAVLKTSTSWPHTTWECTHWLGCERLDI